MRTTLTLEQDVEKLLQREMQRTDRSMNAVLNDALRVELLGRRRSAFRLGRGIEFA